jgi:hypothetical protein
MMEKSIRIWSGCKVIAILDVGENGGTSLVTNVGGASYSSIPDIELDPWAGLIVDHSTRNSPRYYREPEE